MNDRFDAQLREHLVASADTKPAAGQLEGVIIALSGVGQTHPVIARLAGAGGRTGPGAGRTIRFALVTAAVVAVVVASALLVGGNNLVVPTATATAEPSVAPTLAATATAEPTSAPEPTEAPDPNCLQFDAAGTYTQNAGTLPITVPVPATLNAPWSGDRDSFALRKASCGGAGLPLVHAALVAHVPTDACHWKSTDAEAPTAYDVVQALAKQTGHGTVGPVDTHLGPFKASRFDFTLPADFDMSACDAADHDLPYVTLFGNQIIVRGGTVQVYVAEVDGVTVVVSVSYYANELDPADLPAIDEIIAGLRVDM